jgi:hypothetical protein
MTWDISLWCQQCDDGAGRLLGKVEGVTTASRLSKPNATTTHDVYAIMRQHEVEKHGGKS